jgi:hypothetical protein
MTSNEYNEPQDIDYESNLENEESALDQQEHNPAHRYFQNYSTPYYSGSVVDDINSINDGRMFYHGYLVSSINRLFDIMSALTMAISCSRSREYLTGLAESLENSIIECESYYGNHIPLFSSIIRMGKELLDSEHQLRRGDVDGTTIIS